MRVDNLSHRPAYQPHVQLLHRHTDNHLGHRPFFQLEDEVEKEETEVQQVGVDFQNIVILSNTVRTRNPILKSSTRINRAGMIMGGIPRFIIEERQRHCSVCDNLFAILKRVENKVSFLLLNC